MSTDIIFFQQEAKKELIKLIESDETHIHSIAYNDLDVSDKRKIQVVIECTINQD